MTARQTLISILAMAATAQLAGCGVGGECECCRHSVARLASMPEQVVVTSSGNVGQRKMRIGFDRCVEHWADASIAGQHSVDPIDIQAASLFRRRGELVVVAIRQHVSTVVR